MRHRCEQGPRPSLPSQGLEADRKEKRQREKKKKQYTYKDEMPSKHIIADISENIFFLLRSRGGEKEEIKHLVCECPEMCSQKHFYCDLFIIKK